MRLNDEFFFDRGIDVKLRTVLINGDINEDTFKLIDMALSKFEAVGKGTITVKINSMGGNVYDAMAVIGRIRASKCTIVTEVYGCAMSAAIGILACGDKRRVSKYAVTMSHQCSYLTKGTHTDIKNEVKQKEKEENAWAEMLASFSSKPKEYWIEQHKLGDIYFSPEELKEIGVVDDII